MKRKKWSEVEEQTLLSKYAEHLNSGTLAKLKTREKKFKPIADHVNSLHHHHDPITFPFKWSWRDVSIKVQNMRHQYLGVKQKIRISTNEFNWDDGEIHWENFLKYKEVFGDIELVDRKFGEEGISGILGDDLGYGIESEDLDENEELDEDDLGVSDVEKEDYSDFDGRKKGLRGAGAKLLELRDVVVRREEKRREREWRGEVGAMEDELERKERDLRMKKQLLEREEGVCEKEMELLELQMAREKRDYEKRIRLEKEVEQERRQRMKMEEKWEEEELEWRERLVEVQFEHEKQMMQMHADACQNQLQILGVLARLVCQFFGSAGDGLSGNMGTLPPQVLQNLQHPGGLGDGGKPEANLPSEFL
ncbi:stress response protein NST1-like [Salvia hispanica]|uniref:stress response protein NST1-like n=1 Tax=Salvia hispanica TaxID=49212 RepID=UPI002008F47A|nr:stress response protein NST1-like [Salvia hispanica]XP_047944391.1 stress response protein NST1-like [Salvia hispanica]